MTSSIPVRCARAFVAASLIALAACGEAPTSRSTNDAPSAVAPAPTSSAADEVAEPVVGWVAAHQCRDGRWSAADWDRWRMGESFDGDRLEGRGMASMDVAVTSLAMLALAGAGHSSASGEPLGAVAAWGLRALLDAQDVDGAFGDPREAHWPVNQGLALLALSSHAALGADARVVSAVNRGVARYRRSRGVEPSRWTDERTFGGLPAFAWIVLAADTIFSTHGSPERKVSSGTSLDGDGEWVADRARIASWIASPEKERTLAKVGASLALGARADSSWRGQPGVAAAAEWLAAHAPQWDAGGRGVDAMGWWLGTRGAYAAGGEPWKRWEAAMKTAIIDTQRRDGSWCDYRGSWDPLGVGADEGGRVFMTAANQLSIEVWYRYDAVLGIAEPRAPTLPVGAPAPTQRAPRAHATMPTRRYTPCR